MRLALAVALACALRVDAAPGQVVRVEHRDPTALPSRGPATAPVTIELFFTPGVGSRQQSYQRLERLQASHPSKIRLIYRIVASNGQARLQYAALEAYAEGKFFDFMRRINCDDVPAVQCRVPTMLPTKDIVALGASVGIDPDRLAAAISSPPAGYDKVLAQNERRRRQRLHANNSLPNALFNGKLPQTQLSAELMPDLEREYQAALQLAEDLVDRGADPRALAAAFDDERDVAPDIVVQTGATDEDDAPQEARLASPPLDFAGMPAFGSPDAEVAIAVLCSPTSPNCAAPLRAAQAAQDNYPDLVRVVWAPWFDVGRDDAAELALLADAALCAEQLGTGADGDFDRPSSPGWRWVEAVREEAASGRRRDTAEALVDRVAARLHVEKRGFDACRARRAGAALAWIEDARRAGVRASPATIVGGRIYGPIVDATTLQLLVEAEARPGDCAGCLHLGDYAPTWRRRL